MFRVKGKIKRCCARLRENAFKPDSLIENSCRG